MAKKKGLSRRKACKIVKDQEVRGKPLTSKQQGLFRARCAGKKTKAG